MCWFGGKIFKYVDVCSPDKEKIIGITFSNYKDYIANLPGVEITK